MTITHLSTNQRSAGCNLIGPSVVVAANTEYRCRTHWLCWEEITELPRFMFFFSTPALKSVKKTFIKSGKSFRLPRPPLCGRIQPELFCDSFHPFKWPQRQLLGGWWPLKKISHYLYIYIHKKNWKVTTWIQCTDSQVKLKLCVRSTAKFALFSHSVGRSHNLVFLLNWPTSS